MENFKADEWDEARRPIVSLLSKSENAQQKLKPGTWQHSMLRENVRALHIAAELMGMESKKRKKFTREELDKSLHAIASMITRTKTAKFAPKTAQHTLQRNRLAALRMAEEAILRMFNAKPRRVRKDAKKTPQEKVGRKKLA